MSVTYRQLRDHLNKMDEEHLEDNATVYVDSNDEYFEVKSTHEETETGVLDKGHFVLVID